MAATQKVPDKEVMRRYVEQGLTQAQIAEAWGEKTGVKPSRSAIAMAMQRYGISPAHPVDHYTDMLPWKIRGEHMMHLDAVRLRWEARRRLLKPLTEKEKRLLHDWKQALDEAGAVVMYEPRHPEGFVWVQRVESDDDIIRRPKRNLRS